MKTLKVLLVLVLLSFTSHSQTALNAGDVVVTGFNASVTDEISFVLLRDVTAGTVINFTDNGWLLTGGFRTASNGSTNEGTLEWTATSDLDCGTAIAIKSDSASVGTVSISDGGFGLAVAGDQILVYQGTTAIPNFIYGVSFDSTGWSDATSPNTSALPFPLISGTSAINLGEAKNAIYNCAVTTNTTLILAAASLTTNWTAFDDPIILDGCTYTCQDCVVTTIWNGQSWDNGLPDISTNVILSQNYDTENATSFSACSLSIDTGVKLTVRGEHFVEIQGEVNNSGEILIEDKASFVQKGETAVFNNNSTAPNPVIVEKFTAPLQEWYEYTYWSSPLEKVTIGELLPTTSASRLFEFTAENFNDTLREELNDDILVEGRDDIDDNADDWKIIPSSTVMTPGRGYSATLASVDLEGQDGDSLGIEKSFEGKILNSGTITVPVNRNDEDPTNMDSNWNLIGNPYPSAIDARLFLEKNTYSATNTTGTLDGAIYFWSHVTPPSSTTNGNEPLNFDINDYAILNLAGNITGERYAPDDYIPSAQGFFISFSNSFSGNTGDVIFTNEMRVNDNNGKFFRNRMVDNKLWLNLSSDNGAFSQIAIAYIPGASIGNDGSLYDARRIFSGNTAMLYSTIDNDVNEFAIQGRAPEDLNLLETINLGITNAIALPTLFTLSIDHLQGEFMQNERIYLKDNSTGIVHDLKASDYTFTSDIGLFRDRFQIVFNNGTLSNDEVSINQETISILELDNDQVLFAHKGLNPIKSIKILNLLGQEILFHKGNNTSELVDLSSLNTSVYIAQLQFSNGVTINKKAFKL